MIPFNKPFLVGRELTYIARTAEAGKTAETGVHQTLPKLFRARSMGLQSAC
jgi:hypothetical protein